MLTSEASETVFRWFKSELAPYFCRDLLREPSVAVAITG